MSRYIVFTTTLSSLTLIQDIDLEGLDDDPDFWNMDVDINGDEIVPKIRDLTKPQGKTMASWGPTNLDWR